MCANVRKCGQLLKKKVKNMLIFDFFTPKSWLSEKKNHNFEHLFGLLKCRPNEIKDNNKKNDNVL